MNGAGYTKLSNSVLQALSHIRVSPGVMQTYLAIVRLTSGWQKKEKVLSYDHITLLTGYSRGHQYNYIKRALELGMITRYQIGTDKPRYCYMPVLDPHKWKVSWRIKPRDFSRLLTKLMSPIQGTYLSPKRGTLLSLKQGTDILGIIIDTPIR